MSNNRLRCVIISIITILVLLVIIGGIVHLIRRKQHRVIISSDDSCPRPKTYANNYDFDYTKQSGERQILNATIDYFRLSLSWSPTFCKHRNDSGEHFQCQNSFGFIVHGLWPSGLVKTNRSQRNAFKKTYNSNLNSLHPRNCRNEPAIPIEIIRKYFCIMPSEKLMQAEWEKHGTCHWSKPEDYFEQINSLYSKIHLPKNIEEILNNETLSFLETRKSIKQRFLDINPQLKAKQIDVMMMKKGKQLKEVSFCYDHNFSHRDCY